MTTGATAEYGRVASVDAQFFRVLEVEPIIGRTFKPEETGPDAPLNVLISHDYWQNHFARNDMDSLRTVQGGSVGADDVTAENR